VRYTKRLLAVLGGETLHAMSDGIMKSSAALHDCVLMLLSCMQCVPHATLPVVHEGDEVLLPLLTQNGKDLLCLCVQHLALMCNIVR